MAVLYRLFRTLSQRRQVSRLFVGYSTLDGAETTAIKSVLSPNLVRLSCRWDDIYLMMIVVLMELMHLYSNTIIDGQIIRGVHLAHIGGASASIRNGNATAYSDLVVSEGKAFSDGKFHGCMHMVPHTHKQNHTPSTHAHTALGSPPVGAGSTPPVPASSADCNLALGGCPVCDAHFWQVQAASPPSTTWELGGGCANGVASYGRLMSRPMEVTLNADAPEPLRLETEVAVAAAASNFRFLSAVTGDAWAITSVDTSAAVVVVQVGPAPAGLYYLEVVGVSSSASPSMVGWRVSGGCMVV